MKKNNNIVMNLYSYMKKLPALHCVGMSNSYFTQIRLLYETQHNLTNVRILCMNSKKNCLSDRDARESTTTTPVCVILCKRWKSIALMNLE